MSQEALKKCVVTQNQCPLPTPGIAKKKKKKGEEAGGEFSSKGRY